MRNLLCTLHAVFLSVVFVVAIHELLFGVLVEAVVDGAAVADGEREIKKRFFSPTLEVNVDALDAVVCLPFQQHVEAPVEWCRLREKDK